MVRSYLGRFGAAIALAVASVSYAGLTFNITSTGDPAADAGFAAAAATWSRMLTTQGDVVVNISAGFENMSDPSIIGSTGSSQGYYDYLNVKNAMKARGTTTDDAAAAAFLPTSGLGSFKMLINNTLDNPNGMGSPVRYIDNDGSANNCTIRMTNANAKALGLMAGSAAAADATIKFNSAFSFDFDPTDGIDDQKMDFIGVATHEIGHALGFVSGVDILDINSPLSAGTAFLASQFTFVSPLDLFRYSDASTSLHAIDWCADSRSKYFSLNGGVTNLAEFSTGMFYGDGSQASHWKDDLGIGIMDPTAAYAEVLSVSPMDLRMMDVIGWTPTASLPSVMTTTELLNMFGTGEGLSEVASSVPEPTGAGAMLLVGAVTTMRRRQRKTN